MYLCMHACIFCTLSRLRESCSSLSVRSPYRCGHVCFRALTHADAYADAHDRTHAHTYVRANTDVQIHTQCTRTHTSTGVLTYRSRRRWESDRAIFMQRTFNAQYLPAVLHAVAAALQPLLARAGLLASSSLAPVSGERHIGLGFRVVGEPWVVGEQHSLADQGCSDNEGGRDDKGSGGDVPHLGQQVQPRLRKVQGQAINDSVVSKWARSVRTQHEGDAQTDMAGSWTPRSPLGADLREEAGERRVASFSYLYASTNADSQTQSMLLCLQEFAFVRLVQRTKALVRALVLED